MKETCETNARPKAFKEMIRSKWFWKPAAGILIGGTLGFFYYFYVGCSSGTCAITSNPYTSILFGGAMGYYVLNSPCSRC